MIRRNRPKFLSGIPLLAVSIFLAAHPAGAQQASGDIFSSKRVVPTQQQAPEVRDLIDKRIPQMERRLVDMEQKINQLATAQPANIPPMNVGGPSSQPGMGMMPQTSGAPTGPAGSTAATPGGPPTAEATAGEQLLDELYGDEEQDKIPSELQALLSFDPSEVSLEGATFVGCVNDQAMFRGADSKPFFVPATYALNHEAVRLIGGCGQ